jgi:ribonuclease P protein component
VKRRFRLRRRVDFEHVMHAQRVFTGRAIVAFARPNPDGRWRVGVTVSRRVRGAVHRNRLRRRLREAARSSLLPGRPALAGPVGPVASGDGGGFDVVLIARPVALDLPQPVLEEEAARVRTRLRSRPA